jgi:hypothetical protein
MNISGETKILLIIVIYEEIMEYYQRTIRSSIDESLSPFYEIQRLKSNNIHIIYESNEEIIKLYKIDWNNIYEDLILHQSKFDMMIHDIPLHIIPLNILNISNINNSIRSIIK